MKSIQNVKATRLASEESDTICIQSESQLPFYEQKINLSKVKVVLDQEILEPSWYRNILHRISCLGQGDELEILINSPGGSLQSAVSIINAMQDAYARGVEVTAVVDNYAASAGSLIALAAPNLVLAPRSTFMCHNYSTMMYGKGNEIITHSKYNDEYVKGIMKEFYLGFMTEEEIESMFEGKDFYFNNEQIEERLEARNEYWMAVMDEAEGVEAEGAEEELEEEQEVEPEVKPSKKPKKTKGCSGACNGCSNVE
jgi:ATP-dependent protease ClpP protease subunit